MIGKSRIAILIGTGVVLGYLLSAWTRPETSIVSSSPALADVASTKYQTFDTLASTPSVQVTSMGRRCHVNRESYAKLRLGMTLKQVESVINCSGDAVSANRIDRIITEVFVWRASDAAGIEAIFQRRAVTGSPKLMSLSQIGL